MREAIDWVFKQESGISERSGTTAELNTLQSQFVELYRSYDRSALFAINKAQQYVQDNDFERARLQLNSSVVYCAKAEALKEVIAVLDVRKQVAAVKSVPLKET